MPCVVGIVLSVGVAFFARYVGFDRDRAFYPIVMIVIAAYYVLFAVYERLGSDGGHRVGGDEAVRGGGRCRVQVERVDRRCGAGRPWRFDAVHGYVIENAGVPAWWPAWSLSYDVGAAAILAWLITREPEPNDARH